MSNRRVEKILKRLPSTFSQFEDLLRPPAKFTELYKSEIFGVYKSAIRDFQCKEECKKMFSE
ncbi:hypothetical protein MHBO_001744 [Bonamia ostreae]|uniref:Uncharacterized protein n=1 Tax=Bonamia ostreae TaxID=126728 RepID=A0ABV2AK19_9EUKA